MRTETRNGDAIFSHAIKMASADERHAYIAEACGEDTALRHQVEERVAAHFHDPSATGNPVVAATKGQSPSRREWEQGGVHPQNDRTARGTRVGPYALLEQLDESDTGFLFLAEQQEPSPHRVALKLFKDGMDWPRLAARLQTDRQRLAQLNHPNIARILDTGTTSTGRPYLVMDLFQGVPITKYCDEHRLPLRQRLELFVPVCEAVQHAHQKGILHGDLNPSNVLVTQSGVRPAPMILDFGVASGMHPQRGQLEYQSPEQGEANSTDIDTRSDVYSLGVLLYELLTDSTPLERQRLKQATMPEALQLIRDEQASPPSQRLSESKENLPIVAAKRGMDPSLLLKSVQGELDAVVLKALQKDRTQRYQTASELARDIQRYLAAEPVEAYPATPAYRMWKWARKYPRGLLAAVAMSLLLLALGATGIVLTLNANRMQKQTQTMAKEATEERDQAEKKVTDYQRRLELAEAGRETASKARDQELAAELAAQASSVDTKAVLAFLENSLLAAGRPAGWEGGNWAGGHSKGVTLKQAVDKAEAKVLRTFADRPLAEALAREALGLSYLDLGESGEAVKQYERALALREALQGYNAPVSVACRNQLAVAYRNADRPDEASRLFNNANHETPSHASALAINGSLLLSQKKPAEAELKFRKSLAIRQKLQPDDWTTFEAQSLLGEALMEQKKYDKAEPLLLSGYEGMKKRQAKISKEDKPRLIQALERVARCYEASGNKEKAIEWRKELQRVRTAEQTSGSRQLPDSER